MFAQPRAEFFLADIKTYGETSVFDPNTEVWKPLPTTDRSFTALEVSPYLRNDPILGFISETEVVLFGGTKPYDTVVPRWEQALNDGIIIKIP